MGSICCGSYEKPSTIQTKYWDKFVQTLPALEGKVVVITGSTTGLGRCLAEACVDKKATVVLLNRTSERSTQAFNEIKAKASAGKVVDVPCDLSSFKSVRAAAAQVKSQFAGTGIDVLANNAGVMAFPDQATEDGCDIQMQTNHLSHFLLTKELFPLLETAAQKRGEARIVNHTSVAAKMTKAGLEAKYFGKNGGNLGGDKDNGPLTMTGPAWDRYAQSKLANCVFMFALRDKINARTGNSGGLIKVVTAHPGVAASHLQVKSVKEGTMSGTTANLAVSQSAEDGAMGIMQGVCGPVESGDIWGPGGMGLAGEIKNLNKDWGATASFKDSSAHKMLWEESEKSTGCRFEI